MLFWAIRWSKSVNEYAQYAHVDSVNPCALHLVATLAFHDVPCTS